MQLRSLANAGTQPEVRLQEYVKTLGKPHCIQDRNLRPREHPRDKLAMDCIWRANLDPIWAREPTSTKGNLNQAQKLEELGDSFRFTNVIPAMVPFPVSDTYQMKVVCCILLKSLKKGRWEETVQEATTQRLKSADSHFYHSLHWGSLVGDGI
jgi:hypothetical protein